MARPAMLGPNERVLNEILPAEFDFDLINDFFQSAGLAAADHFPTARGNSAEALAAADLKAAADLAAHAQPDNGNFPPDLPFTDVETEEPFADDEIEFNDAADAKGGTKGGGDKGGKGGGRGKDKDTTPEEPAPIDPTPPPPEEPTPEEPAPEEPTPVDPTPVDPTPPVETNPGTTTDNTYISGMDTPDGYNIELVFNGEWTDPMKQAFINAAEDISDIITGDVAAENGIDDVRIQLYADDIDGSGGNLANAGWITLRDGPDKLVSEGGVRVDSADANMMLDKDIMEDMAFHEMLHAMGFGTTWAYTGLTTETADGTRFNGENATEAYETVYADVAANDANSSEGVPLSGDDAHWSHGDFMTEIMTTTLNFNTNEVSDMTVAALEDMGYETVYNDPLLFG